MNSKKLIFNITFHWHLEQLKFHLGFLFKWGLSRSNEFVITTAHKQNLELIREYCVSKYPEQKVDYIFIPEDMGHHIGTTINVVESIKYIDANKEYDYIINIEADNMFFNEDKLKHIILGMEKNNKHMLLIEEGFGKTPLNVLYPHLNIPKWLHITTINVYSKYFIQTQFPKEYNDELMHFGWAGRVGTPYEPYISQSFIKKHNLQDEHIQMEYWNKFGLRLDYDRSRIVDSSSYFPDDMVPDKFMRWGILNFLSTAGIPTHLDWEKINKFINIHEPLMYTVEL